MTSSGRRLRAHPPAGRGRRREGLIAQAVLDLDIRRDAPRGRRGALGEIWAFLWARKLYWITPIVITLLLLGLLGAGADDGHRPSQLFRNLLHNSLQYTDPGGELRVITSLDASTLVIDFQDTPPGVPEAALGHLFDRLYRIDASRGRHTGGAGGASHAG